MCRIAWSIRFVRFSSLALSLHGATTRRRYEPARRHEQVAQHEPLRRFRGASRWTSLPSPCSHRYISMGVAADCKELCQGVVLVNSAGNGCSLRRTRKHASSSNNLKPSLSIFREIGQYALDWRSLSGARTPRSTCATNEATHTLSMRRLWTA